MVTLLILTEVAILGLLLAYPRQQPLMFRLILGLIITWPVLTLYVSIEMPAGIPDMLYHRLYVGAIIGCMVIAAVVAQRYRGSRSITSRASGLAYATESASTSGRPGNRGSAELLYQGQLTSIPFAVKAYVVLMAFSVLYGIAAGVAGSSMASRYLDSVLIPLAMYFLVRKYVDRRSRMLCLLGAIIVATLIVCFTGVYERVLDLKHSPFPITALNEEGETRYGGVPRGRAAGVTANPAIYGAMMGMGLMCCLALLVHTRNRWRRVAIGSLALAFAYGTLVSYTRSAWLSVGLAILFAQFFLNGLWRVTMPLIACGLVALGVMWTGLQKSEVVQNRVLEQDNVTGRVERIVWSFEQFLESPIIGHGPGAINQLMEGAFPGTFDSSHNFFLTMLVDNGIVIFLFFAAIVVGWLMQARFVLGSPLSGQFEYSLTAAMVGFIIVWLLSGLSIEVVYFPYFISLFWIAGAIIERVGEHVRSGHFYAAQPNPVLNRRIQAGGKLGPRQKSSIV